MIGKSKAMREVMESIALIADLWQARTELDLCVYLSGETGVGKSLAARALSNASDLRLVSDNLGAATPALLESRLYGHRKGSFSGAGTNRDGLVSTAGGGLLFLDEIAALPREAQACLLDLLQERSYRPVGSDRREEATCAFVFASEDLHAAVQRREFRSDLFYRIAGLEIHIPPLRDRPEDIKCLLDHFAPDLKISTRALASMKQYHWPGNVRELVQLCRGFRLRKIYNVTVRDLTPRLEMRASVIKLTDIQQRRKAVLEALATLGRSDIKTLYGRVQIPLYTLRRDLATLWRDGKVSIYGVNKYTTYECI